MDDFVRDKLREWNLHEYIDQFQEHEVDRQSLFCLGERHIEGLIPKTGPRARFQKHLQNLKQREGADLEQDLPSTSSQNSTQTQKRTFKSLGTTSTEASPAKRFTDGDDKIEKEVKEHMDRVKRKLNSSNTEVIRFLRTKIKELDTDKKELVGVFGRSGAGKSTLINAIVGEKNLLPTGISKACTSAVIKIEANTKSEFEAQIEFITKEDWKEEWWSYCEVNKNKSCQRNQNEDDYGDDDEDIAEKLTAVYGEGWEDLDLLDDRHFREIPEFLESERKIIKHKTADRLLAEYEKFIKTETKQGETKAVKKWYWPLVKSVTLKVPNDELLQHVTLVDLPGSGDRNKSRDKLWKEIVRNCSTVWVVTEVTRAASEKEAWEILETASCLMGNGGECQQIHFICAKADQLQEVTSALTETIKEDVKDAFRKDELINKHFSDGCLEVFTVSAKDSLANNHLDPDVNEMWKLKKVLQNLVDQHSKTLQYVSGAHGILSLMAGAKRRGVDDKKREIHQELEEIITVECLKVRSAMNGASRRFEGRLNGGVEKAQNSCEERLKSVIRPRKNDRSFHPTLRSVVEKGGVHKPKKGKLINLNLTLSSSLTESIDEEFRKTFPNERKRGAFNNAINKFSLDTDKLTEKYEDLALQLKFLKTEEEKLKNKMNSTIRDRKKTIYYSLTETIEDRMKAAYEKAAEFTGTGSMTKIRETLEKHVEDSKNHMFEEAKEIMLTLLEDLKEQSVKEIKDTLMESVNLSLCSDDSIPDVSTELEAVKKHYDELKGH